MFQRSEILSPLKKREKPMRLGFYRMQQCNVSILMKAGFISGPNEERAARINARQSCHMFVIFVVSNQPEWNFRSNS